MVITLNDNQSIANHFLAELRDTKTQKDSMRFRKNLERLGEIMAYEVSKRLIYTTQEITTPLGTSKIPLMSDYPVLITIMRAGLSFYQGFLNIFDHSNSGFVGAYRVEGEGGVTIAGDYVASGSLTDKILVLIDPMLATGKSLVRTVLKLLEYGQPKAIHLVSAIAAPEGISYIQENLDMELTVWTGAIDDQLNENSYIVPGLGDAGDLCFGTKM